MQPSLGFGLLGKRDPFREVWREASSRPTLPIVLKLLLGLLLSLFGLFHFLTRLADLRGEHKARRFV
jgi:hypothetical protein